MYSLIHVNPIFRYKTELYGHFSVWSGDKTAAFCPEIQLVYAHLYICMINYVFSNMYKRCERSITYGCVCACVVCACVFKDSVCVFQPINNQVTQGSRFKVPLEGLQKPTSKPNIYIVRSLVITFYLLLFLPHSYFRSIDTIFVIFFMLRPCLKNFNSLGVV